MNASGPTTTAAPEAHDHGTSPGSESEPHEHATAAGSEESHTHDASASGIAELAAHEHGANLSDAHAHDPATPTAHADDHVHDTTTATDSSVPPDSHSHEHPATVPADPTSPTTAHQHLPTGPIVSIDDPRLTVPQRNAAQSLLDSTVTGMQRFPNVDAVTSTGYEWIGDGARGGFRHYVNWSYLTDGRVDPSRIESVVAEMKAGGVLEVATAMYILEDGKTMSDVPEIAGELTTWHDPTESLLGRAPAGHACQRCVSAGRSAVACHAADAPCVADNAAVWPLLRCRGPRRRLHALPLTACVGSLGCRS